MADRWTLLLPVRLTAPKGRLTTWEPAERTSLAVAMVRDVVQVAQSSTQIAEIVLLGDPPAAAELPELPCVPDAGRGLNAEVAAAAFGRARVAVLLPDVPAIAVDQLDRALEVGSQFSRAFVADAEGVGTTLLMTQSGDALHPAFGPRSCASHASSGAVPVPDEQPGQLAGLRRDVDDEIGLWDAGRLGIGPHTRAVIEPLLIGNGE
ncbi:MAG: 2-phospho-L-lactate guanylyltransferase [Candidatus Nanopelagicales bacterium]